jgi:hypothetical protein
MNARRTCALAPATHTELLEFLRQSHSPLSPEQAIVCAVKAWIAKERAGVAPVRGYQWKLLFLPEGSQVRMNYSGNSYFAEVVGDEFVYRGDAVSPRQMTLEIAGDGRNAWRDLWVRLPGEKNWTRAERLRAKQEQHDARQPTSPLDAMTTAAKTMSDALTAALMLIEHVDHQSKTIMERRMPKHRREYDELTDDH